MTNSPIFARKTRSILPIILLVIVGLFVSAGVASAVIAPATHPIPQDDNRFWIFNPNPHSPAGVTATMYKPMPLSVITYKVIPLTWQLVEVKKVSGSFDTISVEVPGVNGAFPSTPAKKFSAMNGNMTSYTPMNVSAGWYYFKICSGDTNCQASKVFKLKDAPAQVSNTLPNPSAAIHPAGIPVSPLDGSPATKAKLDIAPNTAAVE